MEEVENRLALTTGNQLTPERMTQISEALLASDFDELASAMLQVEQADVRTRHIFSSGVYAREMVAPADTIVIGYPHKEDCINVCSAGSALVRVDDSVFLVEAPASFISKAGSRKMAYIINDLVWTNFHAVDTKDLNVIENRLYIKKELPCQAG